MSATDKSMPPRKVLVVDNDPAERERLAGLLAAEGISVRTAATTHEALEAAACFRPDLITLEMDMPSPGGTVFYARLRRSPSLRATPVMVLSGVGPRPARLTRRVPTHQKSMLPEALMGAIRASLPANA